MRRFFALALFSIIALVVFVAGVTQATAGPGIPPNRPNKGMIYDGLEPGKDGECRGGFKVKGPGGRVRCTHGPDEAKTAFMTGVLQPAVAPVPNAAQPITCDGDGVSGKRAQVVYARTSDTADRYGTYLNSFKQWAWEIDDVFRKSAAETGGDRRVRWVHDGSCFPTVANVTLSPAGDDNFSNTISELLAQGYNRTDRKYLVFVDAAVYCGIGDISYDDRPGQENVNNGGPNFARVDANCWAGITMGHELMHTMGGVQISAPHTSYEWHCTDVDDLMCRPTNGTPTQQLCAWVANQRFDCNHDDYFHTNPATGSYLATHWNTANSAYLINPNVNTLTVQATETGKQVKGAFSATTVFKKGDMVQVRARVVNGNGAPVSGVAVAMQVLKPDGSPQCQVSATTDANGYAQAKCDTSKTSPLGNWNARTTGATKSGFGTDLSKGQTNKTFTLQ